VSPSTNATAEGVRTRSTCSTWDTGIRALHYRRIASASRCNRRRQPRRPRSCALRGLSRGSARVIRQPLRAQRSLRLRTEVQRDSPSATPPSCRCSIPTIAAGALRRPLRRRSTVRRGVAIPYWRGESGYGRRTIPVLLIDASDITDTPPVPARAVSSRRTQSLPDHRVRASQGLAADRSESLSAWTA